MWSGIRQDQSITAKNARGDGVLESENDAGSQRSAGWQALSEWMCAVE